MTPSTALPNGPLNLTAVAVDQAGNPSAPSAGFTVTVDTVPPAVPQIDAISSSTLADGVLYTNDTTPVISGKTEPGSTVEVFVNETSVGFATVAADGTWTFTPTTPLEQGLTGIHYDQRQRRDYYRHGRHQRWRDILRCRKPGANERHHPYRDGSRCGGQRQPAGAAQRG